MEKHGGGILHGLLDMLIHPHKLNHQLLFFGTLPNNTTITLVKSLNPYSVSFANSIPSDF